MKQQYEQNFENAAHYALGQIQAHIEQLAATLRVSSPALAARVSELLRTATGGQVLGPKNRMPAMLSNTAARNQIRLTEMALVSGSHSDETRNGEQGTTRQGARGAHTHARRGKRVSRGERLTCPECPERISSGQMSNHLRARHAWGERALNRFKKQRLLAAAA